MLAPYVWRSSAFKLANGIFLKFAAMHQSKKKKHHQQRQQQQQQQQQHQHQHQQQHQQQQQQQQQPPQQQRQRQRQQQQQQQQQHHPAVVFTQLKNPRGSFVSALLPLAATPGLLLRKDQDTAQMHGQS